MESGWLEISQIIFADLILSGDNALVVGMAAAGLEPHQRKRVIAIGLGLAAFFRIVFAAGATYIIDIPGILLLGGILLAWVCWRFWGEIQEFSAPEPMATTIDEANPPKVGMASALITIAMADISMSLDNVVAVAAIARDDTQLLIIGLVLAIVLMAFFATLIMRFLLRFPSISYIGLLFLVYLTIMMVYDGSIDLLAYAGFVLVT
ncbi:MAG: YjbE family putative metal transport protein [Gammaproteobacteria bacterium]|jgi:YjbE family integral membrane protein|nr:YjbE family putative metal transport protein [Gammaproteobacteria bacterium]